VVGGFLADADQALQATAGPLQGGALFGLGGGAGDPVTLGGQLCLAPPVAGTGGRVDGAVLLEAPGGARSPAGLVRGPERLVRGVPGGVGALVDCRGRSVGGGGGRPGEARLHRRGPAQFGVGRTVAEPVGAGIG
jgi:hypothetical protein